jgi:Na+-transporting NADH:ubiquinone oxidoreductase subunit C
MRERQWFPVVYMFLTTMVFSSLVIGFTRFTHDRVKVNETLAFERAVLSVLPDRHDEQMNQAAIHKTFTNKIDAPDDSTGGAYTLKENGKIIVYALPISGQGFWAPISGIMGIKADQKTITGVAFYKQNETPGLGSEIAKEPFRKQFEGKVIATGDVPIRIRRPSEPLGESEVHAVTGATQTSTRLEKIIDTALNQWKQKVKTNEKQVLNP